MLELRNTFTRPNPASQHFSGFVSSILSSGKLPFQHPPPWHQDSVCTPFRQPRSASARLPDLKVHSRKVTPAWAIQLPSHSCPAAGQRHLSFDLVSGSHLTALASPASLSCVLHRKGARRPPHRQVESSASRGFHFTPECSRPLRRPDCHT